jgi:hypothetical protein
MQDADWKKFAGKADQTAWTRITMSMLFFSMFVFMFIKSSFDFDREVR